MSKKAASKTTPEEKIILSALHLAESQGWEYTTLRDIAEHADLSMEVLHGAIDDKNDILRLFGRMVDKRVMAGIKITQDDTETPRDRLFEILMDRFDILNDYRAGLCAILESFKYDPKQVVISMPYLCKSMGWMLEASGIETAGLKGALKVAGLSGVYIKVLRVWKTDDSEDLSKTMAELDKTLQRAEQTANTLGF